MYYLDTCVWLSAFNKNETNTENGKIAKRIIEKILFDKNEIIIHSGFVLRELENKLKEDFIEKKQYLKNEQQIMFIKATTEDYALDRQFEKQYKRTLGFYDFMHLAICKNNNYQLVTFDKELLFIGIKEAKVLSPKELLKRINFI